MAQFYAMNMQANFYDVGPRSEHNIGDTALGSNDRIWVYGQASEPVAVGTCTIDTTLDGTYAVTDLAGLHTAVAAADTGDFLWVYQTAPVTAGA